MDPGEPDRDPGCDCETPTLDRVRPRPSSVDGEEPGAVVVILGVFDVPTGGEEARREKERKEGKKSIS